MRTYHELTETERERAVNLASADLMEGIIGRMIRFNDDLNRDTLQASINAAMEEAGRKQTPWFAHEYIRDATYTSEGVGRPLSVGEHLRGMVLCEAEDALYPDKSERVIRL